MPIRTIGEAVLEARTAREELKKRPRWGRWRLDRKTHHLVCRIPNHPHAEYDIPLTQCRRPADVLKWLAHVQHKSWATARIMFDLFRAFDSLFALEGWAAQRGPQRDPIAHLKKSGWLELK